MDEVGYSTSRPYFPVVFMECSELRTGPKALYAFSFSGDYNLHQQSAITHEWLDTLASSAAVALENTTGRRKLTLKVTPLAL